MASIAAGALELDGAPPSVLPSQEQGLSFATSMTKKSSREAQPRGRRNPKAKRKRRTKAEMEAARAAEAKKKAGSTGRFFRLGVRPPR